MNFHPTQGVPTNDEQAEAMLHHGKSAGLAFALYGIYLCKRALELSVLGAYMATLQAYVDTRERGQG